MTIVSEKAQAIGNWSALTINYSEIALALLKSLAQAEMRGAALQEQLELALGGADKVAAIERRAVAELDALKAVFQAAGLAWNPQRSVVQNVEDGFAWMVLALDQEREVTATVRRELESAAQINEENQAEAAKEAEHRQAIWDACWKITDIAWEPAQTFAWNVVNTIEVLAGRAAGEQGEGAADVVSLREQVESLKAQLAEQADEFEQRLESITYSPDAAHLQTLQNEVIRLNDELTEAKKTPAPAPTDGRAARDLAKLLDALGASDVAVALRKVKDGISRQVPKAPVEPAGGHACEECQKSFELRPGSQPRRFCYDCRPDCRKEAATQDKTATCRRCGDTFQRKRNQQYCDTCRARQGDPEETRAVSAARSKGLNPKCEGCKFGVPSKHSDIGWECFAYKARDCMPLTHGHHFEAGEKVVG